MARTVASGLSTHILPTSANLVGACMCAIPLVKMLPRNGWAGWIDEGLLLASMFFRASDGAIKLEQRAEIVFLVGLGTVFLSLTDLALFMV